MNYIPKGYYIDTGYTAELEAAFFQKTMTDLSTSMQEEFIHDTIDEALDICSKEMSRKEIGEIFYKICDKKIDDLCQRIPDSIKNEGLFVSIYRHHQDVFFSFVIIQTALHLEHYVNFLCEAINR